MNLFKTGLIMMILAVILLPVGAVLCASSRELVIYSFYFCGVLELIGLIFVLIHIINLKKETHD